MRVAVLGAGIAGLEIGRRLREVTDDFVILEKEHRPGGLCRTNRTGGYYWDFGVHAIYSRDKAVLGYLQSLPLGYESIERRVKIFHRGPGGKEYLVEYPFETGIKDLPWREKLECVRGYLGCRRGRGLKAAANLHDWIDNFAGEGIARHFMLPYNSKIWNCPLSQISTTLVSSKIEPSPFLEFMAGVLGFKVVGRAYQARFMYPREGIQKLVDHTAAGIRDHIRVDSAVRGLRKLARGWHIETGTGGVTADSVISTIPLVELLKMTRIEGLDAEYPQLRWNDTYFVMVGLRPGALFRKISACQWVFFKEEEVFYRVSLMHNFSPFFPPALVAEITRKSGESAPAGQELVERVVKDLLAAGIIGSRAEIARTDVTLLTHTYPIPTVGCDQLKAFIAGKLRENGIFLFGRNGNWDYINIDGVIGRADGFVKRNAGLFSARGRIATGAP